MEDKKILEIGAEGGGLEFYSIGAGSKTTYVVGTNRDEKFQSIHDMLIHYTKTNDPLLWYFPVEVHPDIIDELLPVLLKEYQHHPKGYFRNLERWEEMLGIRFDDLKYPDTQTFKVTPVQKIETYNYNHFGDERVLETVTTDYSNEPNQKQIVKGIGKIENNAFVIRDRNSVILGLFPLDRYEIDIIDK